MRYRLTAYCFVFLLVLLACNSKLKTSKDDMRSIDLTGTWELREAQNGMMPAAQYAAGNGNRWQFTATTFEQYNNDSLVRSGAYELLPDTTASETVGLALPKGEFTHRVIFDLDTAEKTFIDVRENRLTLVRGFFPVDAGSKQVFVKTDRKQ